jgi:hypothetical protein
MAVAANIIDQARWNHVHYNRTVAEKSWLAVADEADCPARQRTALTLEDAANILLTTPAPTIRALTEKLSMLWGKSLDEPDVVGSWKRKIVGDLQRTELTTAGIKEEDASGRTTGAAGAANQQWAEALREHKQYEDMLMEGPSDRWGNNSAADIVAILDEAEAELLSMSAPTLPGVARKLEFLWQDERFDEVDGPSYTAIFRDFNRLGSRTTS